VAFWQEDMSLRKCLAAFCFLGLSAFADEKKAPLHFSAEKQVWNQALRYVTLTGDAYVSQGNDFLQADRIGLDLKKRILDAWGNCVYRLSDGTMIHSNELHLNLDTHLGSMVQGRITSEKFFVRGRYIEKAENGRFVLEDAQYTTCKDCAASWSIFSRKADLQREGYGVFRDMTIYVKGAPFFWLPIMAIPLKGKRQTGFLYPKMAVSQFNGMQLVQPFFWAVRDDMDMTIGLGAYTKRGFRLEWEGRFVTKQSDSVVQFFFLKDQLFKKDYSFISSRYGIFSKQKASWGNFLLRLRVAEVSDNLYPFHFSDDIQGSSSFLATKANVSFFHPNFLGVFGVQRYRNLLSSSSSDVQVKVRKFDTSAVQVMPFVQMSFYDRLFRDVVMGADVKLMRFSRIAGFYDQDSSFLGEKKYHFGIDPLRTATRLSFSPRLSKSFWVADAFCIAPSLELRNQSYVFSQGINPLNQSSLLFQTKFSTQLHRIYSSSDKVDSKHLIRPFALYSLMPYRSKNLSHPFVQQIQNAQKRGIYGYYFDYNDVITYSDFQTAGPYYAPLGHSFQYGFHSQWLKKLHDKVESGRAHKQMEFSLSHVLNLLYFYSPSYLDSFSNINPLGRVNMNCLFDFGKIQSSTSYAYDPEYRQNKAHILSSSMTLIFERALHHRILDFDRSITVNYTFNRQTAATSNLSLGLRFSLNDTIMPTADFSYNFLEDKIMSGQLGFLIQSPSFCWRFSFGMSVIAGIPAPNFNFNFGLNLAGEGFQSLTDLPSSLANST
jgi:lipopolysaccharide assembly outer membrane protein LptD (OstA)